ncbi:HNH endonuclease signature motif containing protein [Pseudonocardia sp. WMMC193]|uniref:HNH endonuclease n=1 Tax=Pseudonocardia sp. WMMC193 TaxID=2911965 RepID=UPI001F272A1F|nr:HNH endonuclease signature motif containing protein [Pseudonocardia sp. WMMC193]MCF7549603.1 HNH endonuclease [Pseudonocardia sp. WMMC193]
MSETRFVTSPQSREEWVAWVSEMMSSEYEAESPAELIERISRLDQAVAILSAARLEAVYAFARAEVGARLDAAGAPLQAVPVELDQSGSDSGGSDSGGSDSGGSSDPARVLESGPGPGSEPALALVVPDLERIEREVAAQVGLACRVGPGEGRRRVRMARDLHAGLGRVREAFVAGELGERKVAAIVRATGHLDERERAAVDAELARRGWEGLGERRLGDLARRIAGRVAPEKALERVRQARRGRFVSVRPVGDGMADLRVRLPVEQAVGCYAALDKAVRQVFVASEPVTRTRGQIMADTVVERVTGRARAGEVDVEVQVLVPVESLLEPGAPLLGEVPGYGPLPPEVLAHGEGRRSWRRLFTREGVVVGVESRRRVFTGVVAEVIRARDGGVCAEPYCDAPIRHLDHIVPHSRGGPTSAANGRGTCEFHNLVKENDGWAVRREGMVLTTTTPTGHEYSRRLEETVPLSRGASS